MYELLPAPAKHGVLRMDDEISQLSHDPKLASDNHGDRDDNAKPFIEIPGWPASPQSIEKSWSKVIWAYSLDVFFALLAVVFLVYAFYARYCDGVARDATSLVDNLQRAGKLVR